MNVKKINEPYKPPVRIPSPINISTNGRIMWPYFCNLHPKILLLTIKYPIVHHNPIIIMKIIIVKISGKMLMLAKRGA